MVGRNSQYIFHHFYSRKLLLVPDLKFVNPETHSFFYKKRVSLCMAPVKKLILSLLSNGHRMILDRDTFFVICMSKVIVTYIISCYIQIAGVLGYNHSRRYIQCFTLTWLFKRPEQFFNATHSMLFYSIKLIQFPYMQGQTAYK